MIFVGFVIGRVGQGVLEDMSGRGEEGYGRIYERNVKREGKKSWM